MKCIPCRVTFEGFRYEIREDGTVWGRAGALRNEKGHGSFTEQVLYDPADSSGKPSDAYAKEIRADAARQRRNRNARERHGAMTDLGLKRVRGAMGGVYYE